MHSFSSFHAALQEAQQSKPLASSGRDAQYHHDKYIHPVIGKGESKLTVIKAHDGLQAGKPVHVHSSRKDEHGHRHVTVSHTGGKKVEIKQGNLRKPSTPENRGHKFETDFVAHAKKHSVMPVNHFGAGSSAGHDATFLDRRTSHKEHGQNGKRRIWNVETKLTHDTTPAFGQLTIKHTHEKGWHIPDEARKRRPRFAAQIDKHGIIDHMNKHEPVPAKPKRGNARVTTHKIHADSADPANAYLKDHGVHIVHTSHGTFTPHHTDPIGHGIPQLKGKGHFDVKEKIRNNPSTRTVQFAMKTGTLKSHVHLGRDEDMKKFARHLGHHGVSVKSGDK